MKTADTAVSAQDSLHFNKAADTCLNILFPAACIMCGEEIDFRLHKKICSECSSHLPQIPQKHCRRCLTMLDIQFGDDLCSNCAKSTYYFDRIIAPCSYKGISRDSVLRFKFNRHIEYAETMALLMAEAACGTDFDVIVPVPLSKKRRKERKYSQTDLLAKHLSKITGKPYLKRHLIKPVDTPRQSELPMAERIKNVKNAYSMKRTDGIKNKTILLIDDVATTRSTLSECSRVLKISGASKVICLVFAVTESC